MRLLQILKLFFNSFFFVLFFCSIAYAQVEVLPDILNHQAKDGMMQTIKLINTSKDVTYVKVVPYQVIAPGTKQQKYDNISASRKAGIIITPNKLAIQPSSSAFVQVIFRDNPLQDNDRTYRVEVVPVSGGYELAKPANENSKELNLGVKVLVGYALPVIQRPVTLKPKVEAKRTGSTVTIKNVGNTQVVLTNFRVCTDENSCESLNNINRRLYVGNEMSFSIKNNLTIRYDLSVMDSSSSKSIPPI